VRPVAVVGVGAMGSRMARRLLDAGYEVLVWNRSPERLGPLLERGAIATATPREAAERAEVLLTMLADPQALHAVTEGEDGIARGASPALTVIEMSTVGPAAVARLASALPAGTGLLDAPVLGSLGEVESGSLTILAGGPPDLVEQATPLLVNFGAVIHVGGLGSGAAAKLVANATLLTVVTTLGEVIGLARGLGLQDDAIAAVLGRTPLADQADRRLRAIAERLQRTVGPAPIVLRLVLEPRHGGVLVDARPREVGVDRDGGDEQIAVDPSLQELRRLPDDPRHEATRIEHRVPLSVRERVQAAVPITAQPLRLGEQLRRRATAIEQSHLVPASERNLDDVPAEKLRPTQNENAHDRDATPAEESASEPLEFVVSID